MSTGSSFSPKSYKKRPLVIEAYQLTKSAVEDVLDTQEALLDGSKLVYFLPWEVKMEVDRADGKVSFIVKTLEGDSLMAKVGDYIVRGIKGEIYPCRGDIFEELHEPSIELN